jgi:GTP-binding protein LepA
MISDKLLIMDKIRNFCIIAHIDHGKSTLADRFLELTNTIPKEKMKDQLLDQMDLERERGITIKLQPVRMEYKGYILNLIDTPGHMDFYLEVKRSLKAVEGAILLVDAVKGVQAQTLSNLYLAKEFDLSIIPVINKIDLPNARIKEVEEELANLLEIDKREIIKISAKESTNIEKVLDVVIDKVPAPEGNLDGSIKKIVFDSFYNSYKGIISYVRIFDGVLKDSNYEIGMFKPQMSPTKELKAGEIGYIATNEKDPDSYLKKVGWEKPQPMVFASLYPYQESDFDVLKEGINKLKLNDAAFYAEVESSSALGRGFKCGFLGMLHLEIIVERLKREYDIDLTVTTPKVSYEIDEKNQIIKEPWVNPKIITSQDYLGGVMKLLDQIRGEHQKTDYLGKDRLIIEYNTPLADIISDFYDKLKSVSSGYASMIYESIGMKEGDLVRLDVFVADDKIKNLSRIIPKEEAYKKARKLAVDLKELIPRQNFAVPIQVTLGNVFVEEDKKGKIIARETIPALRKDVTGYLYGGDYTRKRKLLEKQKKGKKKMKAEGKVNIPSEVFVKLLKK